jgi:hypothetical protein
LQFDLLYLNSNRSSSSAMGQDYIARKTAKKQRKRDARNAEMPGRGKKRKQRGKDGLDVVGEDEGLLTPADVKRRRKKGNNVSLRISRWGMHAMVDGVHAHGMRCRFP